ncbi:MAG: hypothetical protein ACIALR_03925 [Blastopirellula sp. JB062]
MANRSVYLLGILSWTLSAGIAPADWNTGVAFEKRLETRVDLHWEEVPLSDALDRLAKSQEIAFFLDRRINPDQLISISAKETPLDLVIQMLAQKASAGSCQVGSAVYIGPPDTAEKLATVAAVQTDFARQSRDGVVHALFEKEAVSWPELTEPRRLLTKLAERNRLSFGNLEAAVPHDLWRAGELPEMAVSESLTLLLAGFGATYRFSEDASGEPQLQLIPLPEDPRLTRRISFRGNAKEAATKITTEFPKLTVSTQPGALILTGKAEEITLAGEMLRGETIRRTNVTPGEKRYTLTVEQQPLGAVLNSLAKSLSLELEVADEAQSALHQRISFSVDKVDVPRLLEAVFAETTLRYEKDEQTLKVTAGKK